jgi:transcriptional regulator with XRE-family HTH domain
MVVLFHPYDDFHMEKLNQSLILNSFGTQLKKVRHEVGLSQEEVAHRADSHPTYISRVETGKRNPTITVVYQIADALGVQAHTLLPELINQEKEEDSDE